MKKSYDKVVMLDQYKKDIAETTAEDLPEGDSTIYDALRELRDTVDNFNKLPSIAFRNGAYQGLDPKQVFTTTVDGFCFGYKLKQKIMSLDAMFTRTIFVKSIGQNIDEIPPEQFKPILMAVFDAMLEQNDSVPELDQIGTDTIMIEQDFIPMYQFEKNKNLVNR